MTYARKGPDSNVTVFGDGSHLYCANCELLPEAIYTEEVDGPAGMLTHLVYHAAAGHKIPGRLVARLTAEANGTSYDDPVVEDAKAIVHSRGRVLELLRRLRGSVEEGRAAEVGAYRELLIGAFDEAGASSIEAEFRVLLERAAAMLGETYSTLSPSLELRSDIDGWLQDFGPLRKAGAASPLQKARDVLANTPPHELTVALLREIDDLLDGFVTVEAFGT